MPLGTGPGYSKRAVRKMVKILSLEDILLDNELTELWKKIEQMPTGFIDKDELSCLAKIMAPEAFNLRRSQRLV